MKKILLSLICVVGVCFSEDIQGVIDESNNHWGAGGNVASPVVLTGRVWATNTTLTIEPGTIIEAGIHDIDIRDSASLIARGEVDNRIVFRFKDTTLLDGGSIDPLDSVKIVIEHALIEYPSSFGANCPATFIFKNNIVICNEYMTNPTIVMDTVEIVNNTFYNKDPLEDFHFVMREIKQGVIKNNFLYGGVFYLLDGTNENLEWDHNAFLAYNESWPYYITVAGGEITRISDTAPLFVDSNNDNFHLDANSPLIDAGDPLDDFSNEPNGGGGRINIGAYGNTSEATETQASPITPQLKGVNSTQFAVINGELRFTKSDPYTVNIFSVNGQLLKEISGMETAVSLNSLELAKGIYQIRVVQGSDVFSGQVVLK